ncbi:MAG: phosphatase PAP2 family protein [Clostridiaceae bacterium]|nr:phosphatase PAP2 family protein [Clostridiaceae bacterium]
MTALSLFELRILDSFQIIYNPLFDIIAKMLNTASANGEIFILLSLLLLLYKPTRKAGIVCITALVLDFIILNGCIKPLVGRIRPYDLNQAVKIIVKAPHDFSFPSGHTGIAFAFAAGVSVLGKKAHTAALWLACIMGLSRLYLYVHYPTDVLAGAIVGTCCGMISLFFWKNKLEHDIIK